MFLIIVIVNLVVCKIITVFERRNTTRPTEMCYNPPNPFVCYYVLYTSFITSVTNRDVNESGTKKQHHTFFEVVNERPQGDNYAGN